MKFILTICILTLFFGGCTNSTIDEEDCQICFTCPPKQECLFDSTSKMYIVLPSPPDRPPLPPGWIGTDTGWVFIGDSL